MESSSVVGSPSMNHHHSSMMSISTTSTTTSFQEKPQQLPLISHVDGKFQVDKKSVEIISKIKEPIAVLSIAGVYRSGKSFLLNQILDRNDGYVESFMMYSYGDPIQTY